ncbi:MAG: glycosyltransferase family 2 protein [Bacteroidales bacterium]|nr:glycosyltransferase family 2 protein [Candidatus Liminaster caballi]
MNRILTIIVTYNGMQWLDKCLTMLRQSTEPTDVIVIDNCSTDGTREFVPSHYPEVIWRPQSANLGFGQGNNLGLRYALDNGYDYVLLLNQDAYLQTDALSHLVANCDGESLYSPIHMNGDGTLVDHNFRQYTLLPARNTMIDDLVNGQPASVYEVGEVCAACWFMPIALIRKVGGFNPLFLQYGEDNNYYQRLVYHGVRTYVVPAARMWHCRKVHGSEQAFNRRLVERQMLILVSNPNPRSVGGLMAGLVRLLIRFRSHPVAYVRSLFRMLAMRSRIRQSIITDRRADTNWIN